MIQKIAFRNIWRNKLRSWVVIGSISLGIFGGLAVISTAKGLAKMRQDKAIKTYVSHIQIHDSNYLDYGRFEDVIPSDEQLIKYLENQKGVYFSPRLKIESFVQSARGTSGVVLNGINPEQEKQVTNVFELCQEGNYLQEYKRKPPIIISQKLAEKLNAGIKTTIQCTFSDANGLPVAGGFKVVDIYKTSNSMYDEVNAFVRLEDLQALSSNYGTHEIAILLPTEKQADKLKSSLEFKFPNVEVKTWRGIAPELGYADKMMDLVMTIFLIVIMLALAFGIINTMLMAVLERKKELGMLLSVGMNKRKVFWMIVWESIFLALIAGPIGILIAYITIQFFQQVGIDLSFAAAGLRSVGLDSVIYPYIDSIYYLAISILVILTSILSCIYPAQRALKLNPAEIVRGA
jgi:putative ABC transport system permease protein